MSKAMELRSAVMDLLGEISDEEEQRIPIALKAVSEHVRREVEGIKALAIPPQVHVTVPTPDVHVTSPDVHVKSEAPVVNVTNEAAQAPSVTINVDLEPLVAALNRLADVWEKSRAVVKPKRSIEITHADGSVSLVEEV